MRKPSLRPDAGREGGARPMVAWVEDDPDFKAVVREWLSPRYDLATFDDGEEFLEEVKELEPDVVMLDVRLPGPDGFDVCRSVRRDARLASVPILFLTSCKEDEDFVRHLGVGGTAFLNKPVEKKELLGVLDELTAP